MNNVSMRINNTNMMMKQKMNKIMTELEKMKLKSYYNNLQNRVEIPIQMTVMIHNPMIKNELFMKNI